MTLRLSAIKLSRQPNIILANLPALTFSLVCLWPIFSSWSSSSKDCFWISLLYGFLPLTVYLIFKKLDLKIAPYFVLLFWIVWFLLVTVPFFVIPAFTNPQLPDLISWLLSRWLPLLRSSFLVRYTYPWFSPYSSQDFLEVAPVYTSLFFFRFLKHSENKLRLARLANGATILAFLVSALWIIYKGLFLSFKIPTYPLSPI